ncbi:hypothetical protein [Jatrophihabitans sp.]|jgi:hypothetical protein|uniref:hypothetical protein n=1 Tax=Jatrophihabitans sp. TaxID=1932789 RepID=UPI002F23A70A
MSTYTTNFAAGVTSAAFGAVPAGLAARPVVRNHDITGIEMTKVFGQVHRPRKVPL